MTLVLRPYQISDFEGLMSLWEAALGASWPLTPEFLAHMTTEGDHIVAKQGSQTVGFVAIRVHPSGKKGTLPLLIVHPMFQRQGIGTRLYQAAFEHLRQKQVETIHFTGVGDRFWPGIPRNMPGAQEFFQACGWDFNHIAYDLSRDLTDYQTPPEILERAAQQGIVFRLASPDEASRIVAFEEQHFPSWAQYFARSVAEGGFADILAAWDGDEVVGTLLLGKTDFAGLDSDGLWHLLLGDDMGALGAVGVAESRQGQGIGLAMVAVASEILQARGVHQCLIGWTYLISFYGRLGYTIWREYDMAEALTVLRDFGT